MFVMFYHHSKGASGSTHGEVKESRCYVLNPSVSPYSHITLSTLQTHTACMLSTGVYMWPSGANPSDTSTKETSLSAGHWSQAGHSCGHECVSPLWFKASESAFITWLLTKHTCCFHLPFGETDALWDEVGLLTQVTY